MSCVEPGDECPLCGEDSYGSQDAICKARAGNLMCRVCSWTGEMTNDDSVPVSELRELVDEWENMRDWMYTNARDCAEDLEELIEEHTDA